MRSSSLSGVLIIQVLLETGEEGEDDVVVGMVRWLDPAHITLPQRIRWGVDGATESAVVLTALACGVGYVVSAHEESSIKKARLACKASAEAFEARGGDRSTRTLVPNMHHRRWAKLRKEDPLTYDASFLMGKARERMDGESNPVALAGWEHGWEYAVGRCPLPSWFTQKRGDDE